MGLLNDNEQQLAATASENGVLPAGEYTGTIAGVEKWSTGTSLVWKFAIEGREVWDFTGLTEKGIWRTKSRFSDLGVPLNAGEEAFVGMPVKVTLEVGVNSTNGRDKNTVEAIERLPGDFVAEAKEKLGAVDDADSDIPF